MKLQLSVLIPRGARFAGQFLAAAVLALSVGGNAQAGQTTGACCIPAGDPACQELASLACNGTYQGDFTSCSTPGICNPCGNTTIESPEECDDGNTVSGDGCTGFCVIEFCGDGTVNNNPPLLGLPRAVPVGEQCDDGNTNNGDGCNASCQTEVCGNLVVDAGETCDDGNTNSGDGCNAFCQIEFCGDGTTQVGIGEQCDDGNTNAGDGCNASCQTEFCGDTIVQSGIGEQCEDGNTNNNDDCIGCKYKACGDGYLDFQSTAPSEQCDDANTVAGDGCDAKCTDEFCGDGIVNDDNGESVEQCDDANTANTDSCLTGCVSATCGDGILNVSNGETVEQCDDGGTATGDGCDGGCNFEVGACCHGSSCTDEVNANDCANVLGGSFGGNGSLCSDPGVCVNCGDGALQFGEECDDGDATAGDGCDGGCAVEICWTCDNGVSISSSRGGPNPVASVCTPDNTQSCDDGEICTLGDECLNGACAGNPPILPAACEWVMTAGSPTRNVQSRTRGNVIVHGDICGETTRVGEVADIQGDVVATATSGKGSQFGAAASVVGDIVTGGCSISGRPNDVLLPGLGTDVVAAGTATTQTGDPSRVLDATGTNSRVGDCQDALDSMTPSASLLDALPSAAQLGNVRIGSNGSLTITATSPLHVVDFDRLIGGTKSNLILDGAAIPNVSFVLRVTKKMYLRLQSEVQMIGGATPERVIIYGKSLCKIGQVVIGGGTIFCPNGKLKMDQKTVWDGALVSGKQRIDLRHQADLFHVPLLIGAP